jgi:hypothetical protein
MLAEWLGLCVVSFGPLYYWISNEMTGNPFLLHMKCVNCHELITCDLMLRVHLYH